MNKLSFAAQKSSTLCISTFPLLLLPGAEVLVVLPNSITSARLVWVLDSGYSPLTTPLPDEITQFLDNSTCNSGQESHLGKRTPSQTEAVTKRRRKGGSNTNGVAGAAAYVSGLVPVEGLLI